MSPFDKQIGKMVGFLGKSDASLKLDDLSNYIWMKFQRSLARGERPNWWEVRVSPADAESLGGAQQVAFECLRIIAKEWAKEGRAEQADLQDVVLCRADASVVSGRAVVDADELDEQTLVRRKVAAEAIGSAVAASLKPRPAARYALLCPWNGERIPVTHDLSIGRASTNDVVADIVYVSHDHGQLIRDDDSESGWSYFDLGSTNGSTVNGKTVRKKTPLSAGDRIGLGGSCHVVFEEL